MNSGSKLAVAIETIPSTSGTPPPINSPWRSPRQSEFIRRIEVIVDFCNNSITSPSLNTLSSAGGKVTAGGVVDADFIVRLDTIRKTAAK